MNYKRGQRITFYNCYNDIKSGKILRVVGDEIFVKDSYSSYTLKEKDIIKINKFWWLKTPSIVVLSISAFFGFIYLLWVTTPDPTKNPPNYFTECTREANYLFDNFNDTVGASYAHNDEPSKEVQNFIERCIEYKENLTNHEQ